MKALLLFLFICVGVGCDSDEKIVAPSPAAKKVATQSVTATQSEVLVSNWQWEPSDESSRFYDHDHAQEFTTGSHGLGYTLTGVELHLLILSAPEEISVKQNLDVAIYTSSGGVPGSRLATLTKPLTTRNGFNEYTHAGLDLSPSTSYFVVMDISTLTSAGIKNTVSGGETGAAGWTIGNSSLYRAYDLTTGPWETFSQTKRLRINGDLKKSALTVPSNCGATAITPGLHKGELTGDCPSLRRDRGVNARHVSFSLAQRQQVELTLESPDFDTYLYLGQGKDPASATWTHQNDNIGYNDLGIDYDNNSRLAVTLDAGDYVAELTSLEANKTGSFTLTLKTSAPPASTPESDPLPAPTGLVVTSSFVDDGRITISADWKPVKGADFYRIRLTDGSGGQYSRKLSHGSSLGIFEAPDNIVRPGTTYTVEVSANDGPNKATAQVTTLRRPTGLTVTPVTGNTGALDVSWNLTPGAYNYLVSWRTPPGSGSYGTIKYQSAGVTSYRITGLVAGTEYEVRLGYQSGAFGFACTQCPAAKARGTTWLPTTVEGEVKGVKAENHPLHVTELRLTWQAVAGATAYRVEYKEGTDPSAPFVLFTASTAPLQVGHFFRLMGLEADTEYTVRVTALTGGRSLGSGEAVGTTRAVFDGVQARPAVNHGDGLTVSWPALEPSTGYYHYTVSYRKDDTGSWTTAKAGAASPFRITGLTPNTNYAVRVAVAWYIRGNTLGGSAGEDTAIATTSTLSIQGVEVKTDYTNQTQLTVFWDDDSRAGRYRVEYRKGTDLNPYDPDGSRELDGSVTPSPPAFTLSQTISRANLTIDLANLKAKATVTGLDAGTTYTVRVVALEGASGTEEMGSGLNVGKTRDPFGPITVQPIQGESDELKVWWTAIPRDDISYIVEYRKWLTPDGTGLNTGAFTAVTRADDKATSEQITGLDEDTIYTVRVTARHQNNDIGQASGSGSPGSATGNEPPEPLPTTLTVAVSSVPGNNSQLAASWNGVRDATKYHVSWEKGFGGGWSEAVETTGTSHTITVPKRVMYTVRVVATDADGYWLAEDNATYYPAEIQMLSASPGTDRQSQVNLFWDAVTGATRYRVNWKASPDDGGADWVNANVTPSYTISGLTPGGEYAITVVALDGDGDVLALGEIVVTTAAAGNAVQPEPPQEPVGTAALTGLTAASVSGEPSKLSVSWDTVQGASTYSVRWKTGNGSYGDPVEFNETRYIITGLTANTSYTVNVAALDGNNTLLAEATASGATVAEATEPLTGEAGSDTEDATPAVSFVIYHDPDGGAASVDRYNEAVALLSDAGISYSVVRGDVQDDASSLAGVTNSIMPRFFLGDPTAANWTSQPGENNGGLRWLKQKVAELSD